MTPCKFLTFASRRMNAIRWASKLTNTMISLRTAALALLCLTFATPSWAACWFIENLAGYSAKAFDKYAITPDGLSGQKFKLTITASGASILPSNGMSCTKTTSMSAVCLATDGLQSTTESWSLDTGARKAYQVQARSGYGPVNGATLFVGDITGSCD